MNWLIVFIYVFFVYGISVLFTQSVGPFNIFAKIRFYTQKLNSNLGFLFRCMICFPMLIGFIFSLIDWFLVKSISFTPFNILFSGTGNWFLACIMDMCFNVGICHLIWNIDDFIDKSTPIYEDSEEE